MPNHRPRFGRRASGRLSTIFFVDLDDSLITQQSSAGEAKPIEFNEDGMPASFHTAKQQLLLGRMRSRALVVPTTGRNTRAYKNIGIATGGHAICSFGGVILTPDHEFEPRWRSHMEAQVRLHQSSFDAVMRCIEQDTAYHGHVIADGGMRLYIKLDYTDPHAPQQELAAAADVFQRSLPQGWRLFRNGYHCCAQPPYIGKEKAVAWYLENIAPKAELVIGLGDSFVDAAFLGLCDFALLPTDSQLFASILDQSNLKETA